MIDSWDRLRVFASVARHGSVGEAAAELRLTGPAVSHHLRRLERDLAVPLVERAGRGIRLTVAGRLLAERTHEAGVAIAAAEAQVDALQQAVSGPVRLGAGGTVLRRLVPTLGDFARAHPGVRPEVDDGDPIDLLPRLRRDELDLVVAESWSPAPRPVGMGLISTPLRVDEVRVAISEDHPAAELDVVPLAGYADETWVTCAEHSDPYVGLRALLEGEHEGRAPRIAFRVDDTLTALAIARAGLALALVSEVSYADAGRGVVLRATDPPITRAFTLVRRARVPRPAVVGLAEAITAALRDGW